MLPRMCVRYVIPDQDEVEKEFQLQHRWWKFAVRFNVQWYQNVPAIRLHSGESEGVMMRWGLIPAWAEGEAPKEALAEADIEAVDRSDHFRTAWLESQRCILPAAGFYVWQLTSQRHRQPHFVRLVNRPVFGIAAIWDRSVNEDEDDVIESCALITVPPNPLMADVGNTHPRMPAILHRDDYQTWLGGTPVKAKSLLQSYAQDRMLTHPVSPRINYSEPDDPQLIQALR